MMFLDVIAEPAGFIFEEGNAAMWIAVAAVLVLAVVAVVLIARRVRRKKAEEQEKLLSVKDWEKPAQDEEKRNEN